MALAIPDYQQLGAQYKEYDKDKYCVCNEQHMFSLSTSE